MAIQLSNFEPSKYSHYNLAETAQEKDAAASRDAELIAQHGLNRAASESINQAGQIAQHQMSLADAQQARGLAQENLVASNAAAADQQAITNDMEQQRLNIEQGKLSAGQANDDREFSLRSAAEQRHKQQFDQSNQDRSAARAIVDRQTALANFGNHLSMLEPDDQGRVDVTPNADVIKQMVGGFDGNYKKITAQNVNGKTMLYGFDGEKSAPLMSGGNQVAIPNSVLETAARFVGGGKQKEDQNVRDNYLPFETYSKDAMGNETKTMSYKDPRTGQVIDGGSGQGSNELAALDKSLGAKKQQQAQLQQPTQEQGSIPQNLAQAAERVGAPRQMEQPAAGGLAQAAIKQAILSEQDPGKLLDIMIPYLQPEDNEQLNRMTPEQQKERVFQIRNRLILNNDL
ncbi:MULTISPECIES: hypothetical protein [Methylomonas]|uniref:Uncharacterized protein n=2 Tax=Methylomonas TaxID=416 RepID=A0A140E679_9GAMM|nr:MULTISPECIES: hypothetical protein [Methylomonas]AMK78903.1 hypothetical protein JT25_020850 [Methylomonas denitrificans]OAI02174.1 hypothetical protein A1342_02780 [Methylomonas methanica]TCV78233.1 hypothetical protein EDE11_1247 [Methylomonas methanica]